ncbi:MAG: four helix bundle protein [Alphaproteobacteria bacterium]|nr:four helix bundle protein [Alphaproteobacteria bacterium]
MTKLKSYRDLVAWQKAIVFVSCVYDATDSFPGYECYGLTSQLRRAAVSVPSNIAEGSVRGNKEFQHFLNIARGSLAEAETQLIIAQRRNYLSFEATQPLLAMADELSRILMGLLKSLKSTN